MRAILSFLSSKSCHFYFPILEQRFFLYDSSWISKVCLASHHETLDTYLYDFRFIAFTAAGLCEASGGQLVSLAYTPRRSLRSPPAWNIKKNRRNTSENKFWWGKNLKPKIFEEKNLEKKSRKFFRNFFFDFPKFFPVEIFHMMSRLRMQNNTIIGQGVPEIWGGTDRQTDSGWGFII